MSISNDGAGSGANGSFGDDAAVCDLHCSAGKLAARMRNVDDIVEPDKGSSHGKLSEASNQGLNPKYLALSLSISPSS